MTLINPFVSFPIGGAASYNSTVLADSPDLFLPLDDASGTTASALAGSDGTYAGSPTLQVAGPSAEIPYGISTDGSDDSVSFTIAPFGVAVAQSWELWVDSALDATTTRWLLISHDATQNEGFGFGPVTADLTGEVATVSDRFSGGAQRTGWSGSTVASGWHHHVFTFDGTQNGWTWYIDGSDATTQGFTKIAASSGSEGLGMDDFYLSRLGSSTFSAFSGLAALAVYDYELTSTQVGDHYTAADI